MQTRKKLAALGGGTYEYGDGPLARVADRLLTEHRAAEDARMTAADARAQAQGTGPYLAALRRMAAEQATESLQNCASPCILAADLHAVLQAASAAAPADRGIRMAKAHAYRLWTKDPMGALCVGDVARLRAHYIREYPRTKVGTVIDTEVPRVGFNTLPLGRLYRVAASIAAEVDSGKDSQETYEYYMRREALDGNKPEQVRARAYVRALLTGNAGEADSEADDSDVATRVQRRMATDDDPILSMTEQEDPMADEMQDEPAAEGDEMLEAPGEEELPHDEHTEESIEIDSPITGEPLVLELGKMAQMGELEELAPMEGSDSSSVTIEDPTAPGEMLEVTLKPAEGGGESDALPDLGNEIPEMGMDVDAPEHEAAMESCAKCGDAECACEDKKASKQTFLVYAYSNGVAGNEPIDTFEAAGIAGALRRIAQHGVKGTVFAHPDRTNEAVIEIDAARKDYLLVRAASESATPTKRKPDSKMPDPAIEGQPSDQVSVDPHKVLQANKLTLGVDEVRKICAARGLAPTTIEHKLLSGETVTASTWSMRITDDAEIEIAREGSNGKKTASLTDLDEVIADFMAHVASATVNAPALTYDVRPLFALRCASCKSVAEYIMPDAPESMRCGQCKSVTSAAAVAKVASREESYVGYVVTADIPGKAEQELEVNGKRMLAAVRQVVADATGQRTTNKLAIELRAADEAAVNRVRKVLVERYGSRDVQAQMQPQMMQQPPQAGTMAPKPMNAQPAQEAADAAGGPKPMQPGVEMGGGPAMMQTADGEDLKFDPASGDFVPASQDAEAEEFEAELKQGTKTHKVKVRAKNATKARALVSRHHPNAALTALRVVRKAQAELPTDMPADDMGAGDMPPMDNAGEAMPPMDSSMGGTGLRPEEEDAVRAAFTHFRNMGLGPMAAFDQFYSKYKELLGRFGAESSPTRHSAESAVIRLAGEIYSKPAVLHMEGAKQAGMPVPKPNASQGAQVSVPKPNALLGKSSDDGHPASLGAKGKPKAQQKPQGKFSNPDLGADSAAGHPPSLSTPKPKAQQPKAKGTSMGDPSLGKQTDAGDNKTTKSWTSVSKGAPGGIRSK